MIQQKKIRVWLIVSMKYVYQIKNKWLSSGYTYKEDQSHSDDDEVQMLDKGQELSYLFTCLWTYHFCRKTSRIDFGLSIQLLPDKIQRDKGPWKSRGQKRHWCSGGNFRQILNMRKCLNIPSIMALCHISCGSQSSQYFLWYTVDCSLPSRTRSPWTKGIPS